MKAGVADPKRLGIMGGSYGGYMMMAGLTEYPGHFAAGVEPLRRRELRDLLRAHASPGWPRSRRSSTATRKRKARCSIASRRSTRIDNVKAPTIVLHGANDTNVPVVEAEQVVASLKKRGIPVDYVLFPDEGHGFQKLPNRIRSNVALVRWFARWLAVKPAGPS